MKLTKKECEKALESLKVNYVGFTDIILENYREINVLEQLIDNYFDLVERIVPVVSRCVVTSEEMHHYGRTLTDNIVKQDIVENMVKFLLKENVIEFEREEDYARYQTAIKGKIYIVKPKGVQNE